MRRLPLPLIISPIGGRSCGACKACCYSLAVAEIPAKQALWVKCPNICEEGCSIYETRPVSCATFECLWRSGFIEGDERRRPDNLGLMFVFPKHKQHTEIIGCWEIRPGAVNTPPGNYLLGKLANSMIVYIWPYGEKTKRIIMGPPEKLKHLERVEEQGV